MEVPVYLRENGGAAFILIYVLFLVILGWPILTCEIAIGRASKKSMVRAFDDLEPDGTRWHKAKWGSIIGNYGLMMFYTVVAGWMLYYAYLMIKGDFMRQNAKIVNATFENLMGSPKTMIFWTILVIGVAFLICSFGIQKGVERVTKVMMILLLLLLILLVINSVTLKGGVKGLEFYLKPNFDVIRERGIGNVIFAAMTHAFFTLGIGIGSMEIFGTYLNRERKIAGEALNIMLLDTVVAFMSGLIIFPACFAYNVEANSGPPLLFLSLPNVFMNMKYGAFFGTCFFIFMSFGALSTVVAVFENIICMTEELLDWKRLKAIALNLVLVPLLSLPAIFGYNVWKNVHLLGPDKSMLDFEDFIVSYNLVPLGALILVLFCVKKNGWGYGNCMKEVNEGVGIGFSVEFEGYMKYVLPFIINVVYLGGYYDMFRKYSTQILCSWMVVACVILAFTCYIVTGKKKA